MARINNDTRVVVALGGNALGDTPEEQIARVREAAPTLLKMIEQGNEIIITHGNGPQVGMIQKAFTLAAEEDSKVPTMPTRCRHEPRLHWLPPAAGVGCGHAQVL